MSASTSPYKPPMDLAAVLCPACGLCCNGVLFGDVELQPADDAAGLAGAGLTLKRKGRKTCFVQPCTAFDGVWCRIYPRRPERCRTFVCRLWMQVQRGESSVEEAMRAIRAARAAVQRVEKLMTQLGQTETHLPLNRRFARVVAQPIDLAADDETVERRSELMLVVHTLTRILQRDFLL